jgi:nitrite reductase/ring-hydroxylating ferredoxin subunit
MAPMTSQAPLAFPTHLAAPGTDVAPWRRACELGDLPPGAMLRVTWGDLDVLVAHTSLGLVAVDDRCPHMAAPLSLGRLDGCLVSCPLHRGRFDLSTGEADQFPTTGGLDADGMPHRPWTPPGAPPKPEPSDEKARARALTRVRRLRYYPVRVVEGKVEVAIPA